MYFISPVVEVVDNGNRPSDRHTKQAKSEKEKRGRPTTTTNSATNTNACVKIKICANECECRRHESEKKIGKKEQGEKKNEIAQPSDKHKSNVVCWKNRRENENVFIRRGKKRYEVHESDCAE